MRNPALRIHGLQMFFQSRHGLLRVLDTIDLEVPHGAHVAVLGESGSGKSLLAAAILGLIPNGAQVSGKIQALGYENLLALTPRQMHGLRGREIVLIPQNPQGSLNPLLRVETHVRETLQRNHRGLGRRHIEPHTLLGKAGLQEPARTGRLFPHQLSGGMAQRVVTALGLVATPQVVVADEPTKGLDVAAADHCFQLLRTDFVSSAMLFITHDLRIAVKMPHVAVLYAGEVVELTKGSDLVPHALHPYTQSLVRAHPAFGLQPIEGTAPSPAFHPRGCRFAPRCLRAEERCHVEHPELKRSGDERWVRCFYVEG